MDAVDMSESQQSSKWEGLKRELQLSAAYTGGLGRLL
jgi:hypothetical protein